MSLWRDIAIGAENVCGVRVVGIRDGDDPKVAEVGEELSLTVAPQQHIRRLDVTVDDVDGVRVGDSECHLLDQAQRRLEVERAMPIQPGPQVSIGYELGGDVEAAVELAVLIDMDHVRRVQARQRACFPLEAFPVLRIGRVLQAEHLQGHPSVAQFCLGSLKNDAHAAAAELSDYRVVCELFANLRESGHQFSPRFNPLPDASSSG